MATKTGDSKRKKKDKDGKSKRSKKVEKATGDDKTGTKKKRVLRVRKFMTTDVRTIKESKKVVIAEKIMAWCEIRHLPVVDDEGRLVGLITNRDLVQAALSPLQPDVSKYERAEHMRTFKIDQIMNRDVTTIDPEAPIQAAARLLRQKKIGCLPVVERGKLVGILTATDILALVEKSPARSKRRKKVDADEADSFEG